MEYKEIMTLEEVADFLRVSDRTLYDWAQRGLIPAAKIGTSWRFKRNELDAWVNAKFDKTRKTILGDNFSISSILAPERILILDCASKADVLKALGICLCTSPAIKNKADFEAEIFRREAIMSTGIGLGVGVPHVRLDSITDIVMAVGVNRWDLTDYESIDGKPVRLVFMIAASAGQHAQYLKLLSYISTELKDENFRQRLLGATDPQSVYQAIVQGLH
jgi:PTS system nitrogen regulatory IIA component